MYLFKIGFSQMKQLRQTLTDPDKILEAYVGRTLISRVKTLAPSAKGP